MPGAADTAAPRERARRSGLELEFDRYLRHISIERGLSRNTVEAYRRDVASYLEYLRAAGVLEPGTVTREYVVAYARSRREPSGRRSGDAASEDAAAASDKQADAPALGASSLSRVLSSIRGFHRFLLAEGRVSADVAADIVPPKLPQRLPKALSIEQIELLLDAALPGDDAVSLRDRAMLELLYATGARISELVRLDLDELRERDAVRLLGKGSKQRIVPVGAMARAALDDYLVRARPQLASRGRGGAALFLGVRGGRLSRQNAWLIIRAIAERAGLEELVSPHTFRHSFATHLLSGGADVRVVQELLGHASVTTTQIYTLVTADTLREVYTSAHPRAR